jgi:hypothetical protein
MSATDLAYRPTSQVSAEYLHHALASLPPDTATNFAPLFRRLRRGLPVQTMAIGSSVTGAMGGCTHGLSPNCPNHCGGECYNIARRGSGWLRRFSDWLDVRWPVDHRNSSTGRRSHSAYNGGKGATHFEHYASCLDSYLPGGPVHLFVLEATLPPGAEACQAIDRMKAIERLLETLHAREPRPAVLLLRSLCAWDSQARGQACIFNALHGMAHRYGAPFVDLRAASFEGDALRRHAQSTFGNSTPYPARVGRFTPRALLKDDIHPGPTGEAVIADVLAYALLRAQAVARRAAFAAAAATGGTRRHSSAGAGAGVGDGAPRGATGVAAGNVTRRFTYDCFAFEGWKQQSEVLTATKVFVGGLLRPAHVPLSRGWAYTLRGDTVAGSPNEQAKLKPGLLATHAGAVAEVAVVMKRRSSGGAQPFVVLEYLRAARQMGRVNVSCLLGCSCASQVIDAHSAPTRGGRVFHGPAQHVAHVLRVQLLPSGRALRTGEEQAWPGRAEGAADDAEPEATAEATTCTLRVALLNASSSDGHSFKLVGLQVGEEV